MNGRHFFSKFKKEIDILILIESKLSKKYRLRKFEKLRNKSGKIALLRRYLLFATLCKKCGTNIAIFPNCYFFNLEKLEVANNVSFHEMCYIDAEGGITIGNDVSIAHRSTILSSNHGFDRLDIPIKYQDMKLSKTVIADNVWIGCGCTVLAGTKIGTGTIIGAGSIVTKSVEKNCIAVGVPAKKIKDRI